MATAKKKVAKKAAKKVVKKVAAKKPVSKAKAKKPAAAKTVTHEIVVRVEGRSMPEPDLPVVYDPDKDLAPESEGKKLVLPKTWMSDKQIMKMVQKTPAEHVYRRPGKGGDMFDYVTGHYIIKVLNFVFGWLWDSEVISHGREQDQVWAQVRLTVKDMEGNTITKTQFGRADIKFLTITKNGRKEKTDKMLDFGNDLKAAATDGLKKCASQLGIASDIYGKSDMKDAGKKAYAPAEGSQAAAPRGSHGLPASTVDLDAIKCVGTGEYCGLPITKAEADYSLKLYGKELCRPHQTVAGNNKKKR